MTETEIEQAQSLIRELELIAELDDYEKCVKSLKITINKLSEKVTNLEIRCAGVNAISDYLRNEINEMRGQIAFERDANRVSEMKLKMYEQQQRQNQTSDMWLK